MMASQVPDPIPSSHKDMDYALDNQRKVFMDPIHGHIDLHPLCVKIVDTPYFQRLRYIKQLGACYYVYPGAGHNRFEHSLGVCHLAGQLARAIQRRQPNLHITEIDILCVEIAGLCHDLGHGPFSHMFEKTFIPATRPGYRWKHEDATRMMFRYMLEDTELLLKTHFQNFGLTEKDIIFIEEQVAGPRRTVTEKAWQYEGRSKDKGFLYEIVANKRNGIDVDKWDYLARDCHMLGIKNSFDHMRCSQFARVIDVDGDLQICTRDKEASNLYGMFYTRWSLYQRAYHHRVTNIIENMITEAMIKSNDYLKFEGKNGEMLRMSEAIDDMEAFSQLTDNVFVQILHSRKTCMAEARQILQKVVRRKLYVYIAQAHLKPVQLLNEEGIRQMKVKIIDKIDQKDVTNPLTPDSIVILPANMDYGNKGKNPIDNVRFYRKDKPDIAVAITKNQVSWMLPETFAEQLLRVHSKVSDQRSLNVIKQAFIEVCKEENYLINEDDDFSSQ